MLGFFCRRLQLLAPSCSSKVDYIERAPLFSRLYSSKSSAALGVPQIDDDSKTQDGKGCSFTVSYLINSCGLSPKLALSASKKLRVHLESPEKPDSVIKLLKQYGLGDTEVSRIIKGYPNLLYFYNAEKILSPKLEFFTSLGFSHNALARILLRNPCILTQSLERSIKPCYHIVKSLRIPIEKQHSIIANYNLFNVKHMNNVARNVSILREHQVPETSFCLWLPIYSLALSFDSDKVKANVNRVISMGFHPSSTKFMRALYVISVTDASKWQQKTEFFKNQGWTEDDILLAFRKSPLFMSNTEKTVSTKLDFFMNKVGWKPADMARCTDLLSYSLEKRIIPRFAVIRLLQVKGLVDKESHALVTIIRNNQMWEKLVIKYQAQVPELLSIIRGKCLPELGF